MSASILYPSITIRLWRVPDNFWHLVRSFVRREFFRRSETFFVRAKIVEKSLDRRDRFRPKIVNIRAILAIFKPFQVLKIHMPLFGELSRSSQDLCESDDDSQKSWDDRLNSPKSGMWIFGDQSIGHVLLCRQEMCCVEHSRCLA